eukprot:jgi/Chrzof1/10583/Cz05g04100.t1
MAYVLDDAAFKYIFPNDPIHLRMSIKEIEYASRLGQLSEEQEQRWQKFAALLQNNDWSVFQLITATRFLRKLRYEVAHGSDTELQAVTAEQLQQWAEELLKPQELPTFINLMALAAKFAIENKPLVSVDDVDAIVDNAVA